MTPHVFAPGARSVVHATSAPTHIFARESRCMIACTSSSSIYLPRKPFRGDPPHQLRIYLPRKLDRGACHIKLAYICPGSQSVVPATSARSHTCCPGVSPWCLPHQLPHIFAPGVSPWCLPHQLRIMPRESVRGACHISSRIYLPRESVRGACHISSRVCLPRKSVRGACHISSRIYLPRESVRGACHISSRIYFPLLLLQFVRAEARKALGLPRFFFYARHGPRRRRARQTPRRTGSPEGEANGDGRGHADAVVALASLWTGFAVRVPSLVNSAGAASVLSREFSAAVSQESPAGGRPRRERRGFRAAPREVCPSRTGPRGRFFAAGDFAFGQGTRPAVEEKEVARQFPGCNKELRSSADSQRLLACSSVSQSARGECV